MEDFLLMEVINGRQAQKRAGHLIESLFGALAQGDESEKRSQLEGALRLWSECRIHPESRLAFGEGAVPADCDAAVFTVPPAQLSAGLKVYPLYPGKIVSPVAYDHLPSPESQTVLFGEDGLLRPEIREAGFKALSTHRTAFVLLSGGAGTRYSDSAAALNRARQSGDLTEEQRATLSVFERLGLNVDQCLESSKLFAPMGCLSARGPLEINLDAIAELLCETGEDVPVIIFCGDSTRADVEQLVKKRNGFGLKHLALIDQDMLPFVNEEDGTLLTTASGLACGANGGGGIVYSLGHAHPLDVNGAPLFEGTVLEWLDHLHIERVIFSQTDDAKRPEVYWGLCAAAGDDAALVAAGSRYPTVLADGKPAFKLGSLWSNASGALCCTEFAELRADQIALLTQENHPDGYAVANTGLYLADIGLLRQVIESGLLGIHFQRHKKETGVDNQLHSVTKFEYFMPDLLGIASLLGAHCRIALLRDTSGLSEPLRNLTVDALPAKDIHKLALSQLAKLYIDTTLARAAGLTIEEGALIELGPFARLRAEKGARLLPGAQLFLCGSANQPVDVLLEKTARIEGKLTFTSSQTLR